MKKSFEKAGATLEYLVMIALFLMALIVFQRYFVRAVGGNWKKAGDAFGHGRHYEPGITDRCTFISGVGWFSLPCYDECLFNQQGRDPQACRDLCATGPDECT